MGKRKPKRKAQRKSTDATLPSRSPAFDHIPQDYPNEVAAGYEFFESAGLDHASEDCCVLAALIEKMPSVDSDRDTREQHVKRLTKQFRTVVESVNELDRPPDIDGFSFEFHVGLECSDWGPTVTADARQRLAYLAELIRRRFSCHAHIMELKDQSRVTEEEPEWLSATISRIQTLSKDDINVLSDALHQRQSTLATPTQRMNPAEPDINLLEAFIRECRLTPTQCLQLQISVAEKMRDLAYAKLPSLGDRVMTLTDGRHIDELRSREIIAVLQDLGMSVNGIAKVLGRSQSHLSQVANGNRENPGEDLPIELRALLRKKLDSCD